MNSNKLTLLFASIFIAVILISSASALIVDADYITIYLGKSGRVTLEIENNHNFDIEDVSVSLDLSGRPITNEFGVIIGENRSLAIYNYRQQ